MRKESKLKNILYNIVHDLSKIPDADITINNCVKHRLENSYDQYNHAIKSIYNYILTRDNLKVIKAISKMKKKESSDEI